MGIFNTCRKMQCQHLLNNGIGLQKEWQRSSSLSWRVNQRPCKHVFWGVMCHTGVIQVQENERYSRVYDSFQECTYTEMKYSYKASLRTEKVVVKWWKYPTTTIISVTKLVYYFLSDLKKIVIFSPKYNGVIWVRFLKDFRFSADLHEPCDCEWCGKR